MASVSNEKFLELYSAGQIESAILAEESVLATRKYEELTHKQQQLVKEKEDVASQSGDNWHDGAFKATDDAALVLSEQAGIIFNALRAVQVEYPSLSETRATLGSRVGVSQGNNAFYVDVVGLPSLHTDEGDATPCSIEAPIARAIIGKRAGEIAMLRLGNTSNQIIITTIDQESVRAEIARELAQ